VLQRPSHTTPLYIHTSTDNGAPFAAGKTNFYDPGLGEPLIISAPGLPGGARTTALASELDLMPTILEWLGVAMPAYSLNGAPVVLQGRSLLPTPTHL
jgi:N-sulfoglucosamine sulfohydrolase